MRAPIEIERCLRLMTRFAGLAILCAGCDPERPEPKPVDDTGDTVDTEIPDSGDSGVETGDSSETDEPVWPPIHDIEELAHLTVYSRHHDAQLGEPFFVGDVTGDGIGDLMFWSQGQNTGFGFRSPVREGLVEDVDADFKVRLEVLDFDTPGGRVGDLNGDGVEDLHVGSHIYLGPVMDEEGAKTADITLTYDHDTYWLYSGHDQQGDHNADGRGDLLVNWENWVDEDRELADSHLGLYDNFEGGDVALEDYSAVMINTYTAFYNSVYPFGFVGDTNGDGFDDLSYRKETRSWAGGAVLNGPISGVFDRDSPADAKLGVSGTRSVGDVNGDGYVDIGGFAHGDVVIFLSPLSGAYDDEDAPIRLVENDSGGEPTGGVFNFRSVGDIDRDGLDDVLTLYDGTARGDGFYLFTGPLDGVVPISGSDIGLWYTPLWGPTFDGPAETDGDGSSDLLLGDINPLSTTGMDHNGLGWVLLGVDLAFD